MIEVETVLVLGAGASCDFGFPTGQDLLEEISDLRKGIEAAKKDVQHEFYALLEMLTCYCGQLDEFFERLPMADQPSIDAWLADNRDFLLLGRLLTAFTLLRKEAASNLIQPRTGPANWYKTLFSEIKEGRQLDQLLDSDLKIKIITFNYDRSLEQYLFERVTHHYGKGRADETLKLLKQIPIHHVYGSLGPLAWQTDNRTEVVCYGVTPTRGVLPHAADNIEIPQPTGSEDIPKSFEQARKWLLDAEAIYFLGFGFHKQNMQTLGLWRFNEEMKEIWRKPKLKVMGTCQGLSRTTMNDIAETLLPGFADKQTLKDKTIVAFLHDDVDFNEREYGNKAKAIFRHMETTEEKEEGEERERIFGDDLWEDMREK